MAALVGDVCNEKGVYLDRGVPSDGLWRYGLSILKT